MTDTVKFVLFVAGPVFLLWLLYLNYRMSRVLYHLADLSRGQKISQALIVWLLPFIGVWIIRQVTLSMYKESVVKRFSPDNHINDYVFQALGIQGDIANKITQTQLELAAYETVADAMAADSGGGDGGGD